MGTQGSGRKRAPLKDRFSAEDEALSSIAREVSTYSITHHIFPFENKLPFIMAVYSLYCLLNANITCRHPNNEDRPNNTRSPSIDRIFFSGVRRRRRTKANGND